MPLGPGVSVRLLRLVGEDRTLQLKVEPGVKIEPHAHGGEVHAYNVSGSRRLGNGEVAGPGAYVYEPPGNVDSWTCIGDEPVVIQITMSGSLTYLNGRGAEGDVTDTLKLRKLYRQWCAREGIEAVALEM